MPLISIVTPAYNEAENLPLLYKGLEGVFDELEVDWEWIAVDDHSSDGTPKVLTSLIEQDQHVRTIRFSRNFGSHAAIACGLRYSRGDCVIVMAADLQDPPEVIPRLLKRWEAGTKTVWAMREEREAESFTTKLFSRTYYWLLRSMTPLKDTPTKGADLWLMDRQVVEAVNTDPERHTSIAALIRWMGFSQDSIHYTKAARHHGKSKWTLARKINLAVNTIVASSVIPIRAMSYLGGLVSLLGFLYALLVVARAVLGYTTQGWSALMIVILVLSGVQMMMLGILGEYLWRTYDESRQRPRYIVERFLNIQPTTD